METAIDRLGSLMQVSSFTSADAKARGVTASTLAYYVGCGVLERLAHGVYRAPASTLERDFRWEDLIMKVQTVKNGVICLVSALAVYDLTEEIPRQHWIAIRACTSLRHDPMIRSIRMHNLEVGRTQINLNDTLVPIFDRERTIVDSFRFLAVETAVKAFREALRNPSLFDIKKAYDYSKILRVNLRPYFLAMTI
jgi:predicted transcriptional regulator of viral defense system